MVKQLTRDESDRVSRMIYAAARDVRGWRHEGVAAPATRSWAFGRRVMLAVAAIAQEQECTFAVALGQVEEAADALDRQLAQEIEARNAPTIQRFSG